MTTLNKILDYYDKWSSIHKAYYDIINKKWLINETGGDIKINGQEVSSEYILTTRKEMINKIKYITTHEQYEILTPPVIDSINYCLHILEQKNMPILVINKYNNNLIVINRAY